MSPRRSATQPNEIESYEIVMNETRRWLNAFVIGSGVAPNANDIRNEFCVSIS
jgi:hypothetical protein